MRVDELKNKILQLAIQGKLVKQNPSDTPVSVLLEQIKNEKETLIKEKKIKKEKPLLEISEDEKAFKLPNGWEFTKLGILSEKIHYGYTASSEIEDTGVKFLRITDIQNNKVNWDTVPFCKIEPNKLSSTVLSNNDILIARTGGTIGKSFIVKNLDSKAVFASYLIRVKPLHSINPDYLKLFLESPSYWIQLQEKAQGTGQPNVNTVSLSNLIISLPPLEEQQRIVNKVDELFKIIDELNTNKDEMLNNISNTRNKVLQLAIQGKLVEQCETDKPAKELLEDIKLEKERLIKEKVIKKEKPLPDITDDEKAFELPKGWEWCKLGEIGNIIMGQSPDSATVSENKNGIEFHQGKASFGELTIKNSGLYCTKPTKISIPYDVLLSVRAPVGALNITNREICIGRGLSAIRSFRDIKNKFFYYFIKALEKELISKATGTTFIAVASNAIKNLVIPLPPLEEQQRIVNKVDTIMAYLDELEKTIKANDNMN